MLPAHSSLATQSQVDSVISRPLWSRVLARRRYSPDSFGIVKPSVALPWASVREVQVPAGCSLVSYWVMSLTSRSIISTRSSSTDTSVDTGLPS
ncbi:hypothetical protein D3C86_1862110 [compost metagenome]